MNSMPSQKRIYFIQIPNLIDDSELGRNAKAVYMHLKRVCGDEGNCTQGVRLVATWCKMSVGTLGKALKELKDAGFITIKKGGPQNGFADTIRIVNIWDLNTEIYERIHDKALDENLHDSQIEKTAKSARRRFLTLTRRAPKSKLSDSFEIPDELFAKAERMYPNLDVAKETERFFHVMQSAEVKSSDWLMLWQNTLRNRAKNRTV